MIISYLLIMMLIIPILGDNCDDILCADIFDEICGMVISKDGTQIIMKYKNICYMRKEQCELESILDIQQVPDVLCNIKMDGEDYFGESRRVYDFSIVGAHQACNHTCPTFCTDSYEPACAQIWKRNMLSYTYRPMINHCHIDLFSCAAGLNVTIQPLGKCYKNPSGLLFMQHIAAMKSLHLLDEEQFLDNKLKHQKQGRRSNFNSINDKQKAYGTFIDSTLKEQLLEVVRRIFEKYRNQV